LSKCGGGNETGRQKQAGKSKNKVDDLAPGMGNMQLGIQPEKPSKEQI
jgi:hypothetical protein